VRRPEGGGWRCSYGALHAAAEHCRCAGAAVTPSDLPWVERPGTCVRYAIDEHRTPCLRAVLNHPAETAVRRPHFAREMSS
jgi:hypothetical protein